MSDISKMYSEIAMQTKSLLEGEKDIIANMANISALLNLHMSNINWVGFYLVKKNELVLGPFQGKPACIRIPMGKGVCGSAANSGTTQLVDDVHQFEGHIACDAESNSEIVLPVLKNGEVIAVLDIDSPLHARFDYQDAAGLQLVVDILQESID